MHDLPTSTRHFFVTAVALLLAMSAIAGAADTTLIAAGSNWYFLDDGSDQGTAWIDSSFVESGWGQGPAQLGYGDSDEATVLGFGTDADNKYTTTYFRHHFTASNVASFLGATLHLLRDDGAAVYLNGIEIHRANMPAGPIVHTTFASSAVGSPTESQFLATSIDPAMLVEGSNVLAVEIHQANLTSSDISFDLALVAADTASVTRGPYLQLGTDNSIIVRWRTNTPTTSRVAFGTSVASLTLEATDAGLVTEHEIELASLSADQTYFYGVGTLAEILAGDDIDHHFTTAPVIGSTKDTRVWVLGDSGTANGNAEAVRNAYYGFTGGRGTDVWLMLGDNAYNDGTDAEYQAAVFDMYPETLRTNPVWPTLGNHDGHSALSSNQSGPYYDIFSLPKLGEAGGVASTTEAYYSFDYGNIHFICLDSYDSDRSPGGAMLTWLEDDLMATNADWIIAFWHHPPYSKGSHDSDGTGALTDMRQNALPLLETYGVDMVLGGHSHAYERSMLIDGHYGVSSTFDATMIVDGGDGRPGSGGAYEKSLGLRPNDGAVYVVAGSSGKVSASGALDHPVTIVNVRDLGSLVLDVDGSQLDATFLDDDGAVVDSFTMTKGGSACNNNGVCEQDEDCLTCPSDCVSGGAASCGNGVCEAGDGEDCVSCPADCRGKQNGKPDRRYCCGDGAGEGGVACADDSRCESDGWQCIDSPAIGYCCGDGACDGAEDSSVCALDCGAGPACGDGTCDVNETACSCAADCGAPLGSEAGFCGDGGDNDCDGDVDCDDSDCAGDPSCGGVCEPLNAACAADDECCSLKCKGKPGAKVCK